MSTDYFPEVQELLSIPAGSTQQTPEGYHLHGFHAPFKNKDGLELNLFNKPRVMVRVDVLPDITSVAGYACRAGVNYMLVYKDQIASIQKQIPTPKQVTLMETANEVFEGNLQAEIGPRLARARTPDEAERIRMEGRNKTVDSPQRQYHLMTSQRTAGLPPVVSLAIGPECGPPDTTEVVANKTAQSNAEMVAAAVSQSNKELMSMFAELLKSRKKDRQES